MALNVAGVSVFTLSNDPEQKTMASFGGFEVQRTLSGTSVTIITPRPTPVLPKPLVDLELNLELAGADSWVPTSSSFDVTILVSPNDQPVSGIQSFINFDPTKVSVVSIEFPPDSPLGLNLRTEFDNDSGGVIIAAGTLGDPVTRPFSLAVITFLSASEPSLTHIGFSTSTPRNTIASVDGIEVQRDTTGIEVRVGAHSDLRITKLATPRTVRAGDNLIYTLNVQNIGPETALEVTVSDRLAQGMEFIEAVPSQGECSESERNVVCNLGDISVGESAQVEIIVRPELSLLGETIVNEAVVSSPRHDPSGDDNIDRIAVEIPSVSQIGLLAMAGVFAAILLAKFIQTAKQG
jgi:uncharacterized repeat protein (TIGR01451 family)